MKSMNNYLRKRKHRMYIAKYLNELRWESLNIMISASATEWTQRTTDTLLNNAHLIRKYERRRRWLRF